MTACLCGAAAKPKDEDLIARFKIEDDEVQRVFDVAFKPSTPRAAERPVRDAQEVIRCARILGQRAHAKIVVRDLHPSGRRITRIHRPAELERIRRLEDSCGHRAAGAASYPLFHVPSRQSTSRFGGCPVDKDSDACTEDALVMAMTTTPIKSRCVTFIHPSAGATPRQWRSRYERCWTHLWRDSAGHFLPTSRCEVPPSHRRCQSRAHDVLPTQSIEGVAEMPHRAKINVQTLRRLSCAPLFQHVCNVF